MKMEPSKLIDAMDDEMKKSLCIRILQGLTNQQLNDVIEEAFTNTGLDEAYVAIDAICRETSLKSIVYRGAGDESGISHIDVDSILEGS